MTTFLKHQSAVNPRYSVYMSIINRGAKQMLYYILHFINSGKWKFDRVSGETAIRNSQHFNNTADCNAGLSYTVYKTFFSWRLKAAPHMVHATPILRQLTRVAFRAIFYSSRNSSHNYNYTGLCRCIYRIKPA